MNIKDKIKKLLINNKNVSSIAALERASGLSNGTINKWDKATPNMESAKKVADILNVSVDYLLGNTDNPYIKSADEPNELTEAVTEVVNDAINNAQAYNGKAPTESDKKLMTDLLTAWLKSGGK